VVVCHNYWPYAVFAPVVRSRGLPLVLWAHDVPNGRHWIERWARRTRPDLVLANSRFTQSAVAGFLPGVPSEVLYAPAPAPLPGERGAVRRRVRAALDTPEDATVVVQASRCERWKGHAVLLQALGRLRGVPGWCGWLTCGPQRSHERAYAEELQAAAASLGIGGRVRFLGPRRDVPDLLAAADVHCQPNTAPEPFGLAFVEAMYAGLPVVTTAFGAALEVVAEDCGVLVPPGSVVRLAEVLRRLILDGSLRRALGAAGPSRARLLCDPATQLGRLQGLLNRVVHADAVA
jgi:glycosyltransferase involved in cell wall biosynthesis